MRVGDGVREGKKQKDCSISGASEFSVKRRDSVGTVWGQKGLRVIIEPLTDRTSMSQSLEVGGGLRPTSQQALRDSLIPSP